MASDCGSELKYHSQEWWLLHNRDHPWSLLAFRDWMRLQNYFGRGARSSQNLPDQLAAAAQDVSVAQLLECSQVSNPEHGTPIPFWDEVELKSEVQSGPIANEIGYALHPGGVAGFAYDIDFRRLTWFRMKPDIDCHMSLVVVEFRRNFPVSLQRVERLHCTDQIAVEIGPVLVVAPLAGQRTQFATDGLRNDVLQAEPIIIYRLDPETI
jgi:hypothetical protein